MCLYLSEDVTCRLNDDTGTSFNITITVQDPQFRQIVFLDPTTVDSGNISVSNDPDCQGTLTTVDEITFTFMTSDVGSKCFLRFDMNSVSVVLCFDV